MKFLQTILASVLILTLALPVSATTTYTYTPTTIQSQSNWYSPEWKYRIKVTVNHEQVGEEVTDFPMLVKITNNQKLFKNAKQDGHDLLFTSSDGITKLDHEIEQYDKEAQHLVAWVKVPKLSVTEDTELYAYYGNSNAEDQQRASAVWGSEYDAVYHFNTDPATTIFDSEKDARNGENGGSMNINDSFQDAKVGKGYKFDGADDVVDLGDQSFVAYGPNDFEWSMWIKDQGPTTNQSVIIGKDHSTAASYRQFALQLHTGALGFHDPGKIQIAPFETDGKLITFRTTTALVELNKWYYIVLNRKNGVMSMSVNGKDQLMETAGFGGGTQALSIRDTPAHLQIGGREYVSARSLFKGIIDDVRFSKNAHNGGWIRTEYNNQSDPESFYTLSVEQTQTSTASNNTLTTPVYVYTTLSSFKEQATKNTGTILYQLSPDNGKTWYYRKNNHDWTKTTSKTTGNPAWAINTGIAHLPKGTGQLKIRAYLKPKNAKPVSLEQLTIGYTK